MKVLHFSAVASHPRVVGALMAQAHAVTWPFSRYLDQAIHTAKQRQTRYALPWQQVKHLHTCKLEARDTLLRIPRRMPGTLIKNWPSPQPIQLDKPALAVERSQTVAVVSAHLTAGGLAIHTREPLHPGEKVFWCGLELEFEPEPPPSPPTLLVRQGQALRQVAEAQALEDSYWKLLVEGIHGDGVVEVDGEKVDAETLSPWEGLTRVEGPDGRHFSLEGETFRCEEPPAEGTLRGNNGVHFHWTVTSDHGRQGIWIQLLPPRDPEADELLDPRVAFCEEDISEVWTSPHRSPDSVYRVKRVDRDRYQLQLEELPPTKGDLYLPVDLRNLYLQRRALNQLAVAPLPHHAGLLRLCEDTENVRWPAVQPSSPPNWLQLVDETRSGTQEQRNFVAKALGTPDFAFLQGPPGSGKTTAICEIVRQLIHQGQRVLLCASTHVAIDNVLERLVATELRLDAIRIGKVDRVDENVRNCQLDTKTERLVATWRGRPDLQSLGDGALNEMAERTVIMAANLTCGTTMGIVSHPLFMGRDQDIPIKDRPIATYPHWDVLIIDEASKTLVHEFMVPALMARRHIIVGDVRQLPPFTERKDIVANLRDLVDDQDRPLFTRDQQRARWLWWRMTRPEIRNQRLRWLFVEPAGVISALLNELDQQHSPQSPSVVRVIARNGAGRGGTTDVTLDQIRHGNPDALRLLAADWVLVPEDLLKEVAHHLPGELISTRDIKNFSSAADPRHPLLYRQSWCQQRARPFSDTYYERKFSRDPISTPAQAQACEQKMLLSSDLAQEITWRITRIHELRYSHNRRDTEHLQRDLRGLIPENGALEQAVTEIQDIGLPSILEVLQEGIGDRATRRSALTEGIPRRRPDDFKTRFEALTYQHRMHPDIATFPREHFYQGTALQNANTITLRDKDIRWDFGPFPSRRVWIDVRGREEHGENHDEIQAIERVLRRFIDWARSRGRPPGHPSSVWEVACLSFYVKQDRAMSNMLRRLTGHDRQSRFRVDGVPVEIVCGTVDRFQGREADLVCLSLRNTRRVGFLDSPNRLNVAITRARQQLIIVGNNHYFAGCHTAELEALAKGTARMEVKDVVGRKS